MDTTQNQLQDAIQKLQGSGAAPTPTQTSSTMSQTQNGELVNNTPTPVTPASTEKKPKEKLSVLMKKYLVSPDAKKTVITAGHPAFKVKQFMSEKAEICGFITQFNSRIDVALYKVDKTYHIGLKEKMSSNYVGVIVRYPRTLTMLLTDQVNSNEEVGATPDHGSLKDIQEQFLNSPDQVAWMTRIMTKEEFFLWTNRYCHTTIREARAIYHPHYKSVSKRENGKSVKLPPVYVSEPDSKGNFYFIVETLKKLQNKISNGSYDKEKGKVPTVCDLYKLKPSYRGTLICEENYIAMERYSTIKFKSNYSQEEVDLLNRLYVEGAFPKKQETFDSRIAELSEAARNMVTSTEKGKFASQIFNTQGSIYNDPAKYPKIRRYWSSLEFFNHEDINLVEKVVSEKKPEGFGKLVKIPFGTAGNTLNMYPQVVEAAKDLTTEKITEFISKVKSSKSNKSERTQIEHDIAFDAEAVLNSIIGTL